MKIRLYKSSQILFQYITRLCLDCKTLNIDILDQDQPYLLACTHISHLEPFLLSSVVRRPIRWIARTEMFQFSSSDWLLKQLGAIRMRRNYPSLRAIHESINQLKQNQVVGIFPEGQVRHGNEGIIRGAPFKQGAILIAQRANVPIIPVIILGTEKLNAIEPWLPGSRYQLRIAAGNPVFPQPGYIQSSISVRRRSRHQMAQALGNEFVKTYQEMLRHFQLDDAKIP